VLRRRLACCTRRCLLTDDNATRDALTWGIYSVSGIAALIDIRGRVPTIDEYKHARHEHPAWPHDATLGRLYGSWLSAVSAAVQVIYDANIRFATHRSRPMPTDWNARPDATNGVHDFSDGCIPGPMRSTTHARRPSNLVSDSVL
jgi:hypothetical protein